MSADAPVTRGELVGILGEFKNEFKREIKADILEILKEFKTEIKADIQKLSKDFYSFKKYTENYIQRDSRIIETELNQTLSDHINDLHPGYVIQRYDSVVKTIKHPYVYGKKLTEFDGLYLLSPKPLGAASGSASTPNRHLILLEAKKYIDLAKVEYKLKQWQAIKNIIRLSRDPSELAKTQPAFQNTAKMLKLNDIGEVYLYIGGLDWEQNAHTKIKEAQRAELTETGNGKSTIGYVYLSGRRYEVADNIKMTAAYQRGRGGRGGRNHKDRSDASHAPQTTIYNVNVHGVTRI